ncbi:MAG: hypothetical protein JNK82_42510 [Myxococcaceae bacterium]|nr:hypothetical protein [Myxococcaceae bacterium]
MRFALFLSVVCLALVTVTCTNKPKNLPPSGRFYFPSGIHHARPAGSTEGVLYVVNANLDRRYDTGTMTAVDLDAVGLPPFGTFSGGSGGPLELMDLKIADPATNIIQLANFGGDLGTTVMPDGTVRMFVSSRAEGQKLMAIDARGTSLSCVRTLWADGGSRADPVDERDCGEVGASLVEYERTSLGVPRADSPLSVTVDGDGGVWVASGRHADSPRFSNMEFNDYIVRTDRNGISVGFDNFVALGVGSTHAVAAGRRWVYFSGRLPSVQFNPPLVRMVDSYTGAFFDTDLEVNLRITDARGIALAADERRLFLAGRQAAGAIGSDVLVVATIADPMADTPSVSVLRTIPVPAEPLMVKTVSRGPGRGDLVFVACGFGFGSLVIYDDERGDRAAQIDGIGTQASSIAVDVRQSGGVTGARVYVTAHTDGRVAVIDVPNLDAPQDARLVAHLGLSQVCLTRRDIICDGGVAP